MKQIIGSLFVSLALAVLAIAQAAPQKPEQGKPDLKPDPATLKEYAGRYELDPNVVQNFILDITFENGDLWVKPSHQEKHKLVARGKEEFADEQLDNIRIRFNRDNKGGVTGATLTQDGQSVEAKKLALAPPSVKGNTTFKLKGHADARIVALAGSFNNWNQSQFLFAREGDEWVCRIDLLPGRYTYKFIVDGIWMTDPANPVDEDDGNGNINSVLVVKLQ
jgi:Glycogen recognition site of AMP-activated protein kinase